MSLLVDKWRPKNLDDLGYHKDLSERLRALVSAFTAQRERRELTLDRTRLCRLKPTSLTRSSTVLLVQARRHVSCAL